MISPTPPNLATHPDAVRARKLPIAVQVKWMAQAGVCQTLEGPVAYQAGDPLLTGPGGESWPMAAARFAAAYRPLAPTVAGADGRYLKQPVAVHALRLDAPMEVAVGYRDDLLQAQPGDWLLQYGPGEYGVVAAEIFGATYELVAD